jgi:hypothetical protein
MNCKFCSKLCKNLNSLRNHERLCKSNPHAMTIKSNFIDYNQKIKNGLISKTNSNQYTKAKSKGKVWKISEETRAKMSKSGKLFRHTKESIEKLKLSMRKAVINNPDSYTANNVSGRTPIIEYKGFKGTWELLTAKWLDLHNIKWTNKIKGFEYVWENSIHIYYPDFYLSDYDKYIEVKGYERDRDRAKWKVVKNLCVFKKDEISKIKENTLSLSIIYE